MRLIKGTALALAAALLVASTGNALELNGSWKEHTSRDGKFRILMPGEVQTLTRTETVPLLGKMDYHLVLSTREQTAYVVVYADFPGAAATDSTAEQLLDLAGPGYARGMNGKILSEKKVSMSGNPGREYVIEVPGQGIYVQTRIYVVGKRVYFVNIMSRSRAVATSAEAGTFLDSFKLIDDIRF